MKKAQYNERVAIALEYYAKAGIVLTDDART